MLEVPKRLREVNIIIMRILKSRNLVPERVNLFRTVFFDFINALFLKYACSFAEQRLKKLSDGKIFNRLALPCVIGGKKLIGLGFVNRFARKGNNIGNRLAAFFVK